MLFRITALVMEVHSVKTFLELIWKSRWAFGLTVSLFTCGSLPTTCGAGDGPESGRGAVEGGGEHVIKAPSQPKVEWSPADRALRKAMAGDPSFSTDALRREVKTVDTSFPITMQSDITQATAIDGWKRFLERDDLTKEQQVFAWWRIGSLYAYNFDPSRGEKANHEQAARAMEQVRKVIPGLVSFETLNSATVFGSLGRPPRERAQRLAEAFNWMASLDEKDIDNSASRVNRAGYVIDERHTPGGGKPNQTFEERKQFVKKLLADYRQSLARHITEWIECTDDPVAIAEFLKAVEGSADPRMMVKWREMHRKVGADVLKAGTTRMR